jgi:predicted nucleotidyltransferase
LLKGLDRAGVAFVVIGGVAAVAHGSVRVTNDLDICYDPDAGNTDRLARLLRRWHAYPRGVELGLPFILDARTFRDVHVLTLTTDEGDLDVMDEVVGVGSYERVRKASQPVTVEGVRAHILGLDALIRAKRATRRPKDEDVLVELEALRELRRPSGGG